MVNTRYKDKEYIYLKLLESRREGDKVKHKQLVNLSGIGHLQADRIKPLFDDLNKTLGVYKETVESGPPWCRYLKTAYLLALENAFRLEHRIQDRDLREILLQDGKRKHTSLFNENMFYGLIRKKTHEYEPFRGFICWLENQDCYLVDLNGFPLKFSTLSEQQGEEVANFLFNIKIEDREPEFFLARACERFYDTFSLMGLLNKEKGYTTKEIFIYKQLTDWSGKPDLNTEKMLICGSPQSISEQHVNEALMAVNNLKSHFDYVRDRIVSVIKGNPPPDQDLTCTCFVSSFFYKIISNIKVRNNV
ncbi:MAG: hypothetical protein ACOY4I_13920 [Bacillota bacterium]